MAGAVRGDEIERAVSAEIADSDGARVGADRISGRIGEAAVSVIDENSDQIWTFAHDGDVGKTVVIEVGDDCLVRIRPNRIIDAFGERAVSVSALDRDGVCAEIGDYEVVICVASEVGDLDMNRV